MTKQRDTSTNYYHLSQSGRIKIAVPKVSSMAVPSFEDMSIPRVSFAPSIDQCISALIPAVRTIFYVYVPEDLKNFQIYKPKIYQVRDCKETGEVWSLKRVRVKRIGKIKITKSLGYEKHKNYRGVFHIHRYDWEWVEKY